MPLDKLSTQYSTTNEQTTVEKGHVIGADDSGNKALPKTKNN